MNVVNMEVNVMEEGTGILVMAVFALVYMVVWAVEAVRAGGE